MYFLNNKGDGMEFPENPYQREEATGFMYKIYGWMSFALAITALVAFYIHKTPVLSSYFKGSFWVLILLIILQFALVIAISAFILRMSYATAILLFMLYAISVGITFSFIFEVYTTASIYATFLVTALMFLVTCLYGYFTKADLTSWGSFGFMALIGIIIASFVNIFLKSTMFGFIMSIIGVFVFVLLTAYDTQKLKELGSRLVSAPEMKKKITILGALTLYLDFINLFLFLLRLMGQQKNN